MKRSLLSLLVIVTVLSCAPVLRRETLETGMRDVLISEIRNNPDSYRGELFILGGLIVNTKFIKEGSQIEALYIPVDSRGHLKDIELSNGRFLAIYPKEKGLLDPLIYRKERQITLAGEFIEIHSGKIGEMEYNYPVFEIIEIYLWKEREVYYPNYWDYHYYPYWWDPWWRPWWGPWWRYCPPYWW